MNDIKFITEYNEFGGTGGNIDNHFKKLPEEDKIKVLKYLKGHKKISIRCSLINDYVKGVVTTLGTNVYTDGEYNWADDETYHFEHYDLELNEDFIKKVLNS